MTTKSFVPRPIFHVKDYGYVVESGDTPSGIARKFNRPAGDYRELVAANLVGRTLMPMALGSPYSALTFASLSEGEVLRVPARWPDPAGAPASVGEPGVVGDPQLDQIASGVFATVQAASAASGGAYDQTATQAITNAALQYWYSVQGTNPASDPSQYLPYVQSAMAWFNSYGQQILTQTGNPAAVTSFPWGAFLAMLPATQNIASVDWLKGTIAGTSGIPWSSIPWGYLGQLGTGLEAIKVPSVAWPYDKGAASVAAAVKAAVDAGQAAGSGGAKPGDSCGISSHVATDLQCYCDPGYRWMSVSGTDCVKAETGTPATAEPKSQADCKAGEVFDAQGPSGAHCYTCDAPLVYNPNSAQCECPSGQQWNGTACVAAGGPAPVQKACPKGTTWDAAAEVCVQDAKPAPQVEPTPAGPTTKSTLVLAAVGVATVVALGAGAVFLATRDDKAKSKDKP